MSVDTRRPLWTTALVVLGSVAVVALGLLSLGDRTDGSSSDASATADATVEPTPPPSGTVSAHGGTPSPNPSPQPTLTPSAPPAPLVTVDVFNQTGDPGLAARTSAVLAGSGWTVGQVADALLSAPSTTLYVPPGLESEADAFLSAFPAVSRTRPSFEGLALDGLTLVLAQPDAELVVSNLEFSASLPSASDVPTPVGASP